MLIAEVWAARVVAFLVASTGCSSAWRFVRALLGITQVAVVLLVHVIRIVRIKLFSEAAFRSRHVYCWG